MRSFNQMGCKFCGATALAPRTYFCKKCRRELKESDLYENGDAKVCDKCNISVNVKRMECMSCGRMNTVEEEWRPEPNERRQHVNKGYDPWAGR